MHQQNDLHALTRKSMQTQALNPQAAGEHWQEECKVA